MSAWLACGQPRCVADALLPLDRAGDLGPLGEPDPVRLHRLPDIDVRVAGDQHVRTDRRPGDVVGDPALLGAGHEVVDEHADLAVLRGAEVAQVACQVVDAAEVLNDHALDPQVVAPDLLDELGVVPALDVDPAGPRDPRPCVGDRDRAGCRAGGLRGRGPTDRRPEDHRLALQQESRPEREGPAPAPPVLQRQRVEVAVDRHDLAAPVGGDLLDHRPELGRGLDGTPALRSAPVGREHVGSVAVGHAHDVMGGRRRRRGAHADTP